MTCRELVSAIDAYLDGELPTLEILRVHGHLLTCDSCRIMLESEATLHSLLRTEANEDEPPPELRSRVLERIGAASSGQSSSKSRSWRSSGMHLVLGAIGVVALLLAGIVAIRFWRPPEVPPFVLEIAAKHRLYTERPSHALEMTTGDVVGLTDWLERRVGFPVKAPGLLRSEQRLVGGRVSSVADAPAAYLLYEWHGRLLSLFVTASQPRGRPEGAERIVDGVELYTATLSGVTLVWWEESGRLYTAVSADQTRHLEEFAVLCVRGRPLTSAPDHVPMARRG
jgi:mycothiol system anti-sigma-R factor